MAAAAPSPMLEEHQKRILERYEERIKYYWSASSANKRSYKMTRYSLIVLGAAVTLISSISSASFLSKSQWAPFLAVLTPILAASMAIVSGISQAFQWGAAWADMVITATRLEKERDRVAVTPIDQLDPVKEMALLDDLVLGETQGFFQRLFGSNTGTPKSELPGPPAAGQTAPGTSR